MIYYMCWFVAIAFWPADGYTTYKTTFSTQYPTEQAAAKACVEYGATRTKALLQEGAAQVLLLTPSKKGIWENHVIYGHEGVDRLR